MQNIIQTIKRHTLIIAAAILLTVPLAAPAASTSGLCSHIAKKVQIGANQAADPTGNADDCNESSTVNDNSIGRIASGIVNIFSLVVGAIAIIMIIYGGFRYITSGGDSGRVGNAKNTLIYAIVGLIIVALAQVIVHVILNRIGAEIGT